MNPSIPFSNKLNSLRTQRNLTVRELAKLADVPNSLISGLQTENRVIGEFSARKIGVALQLHSEELDDFVYLAVNNCSEKVLKASKDYPVEVINFSAGELYALGILPEKIMHCVRKPPADDANAALYLNDGKAAFVKLEVAVR